MGLALNGKSYHSSVDISSLPQLTGHPWPVYSTTFHLLHLLYLFFRLILSCCSQMSMSVPRPATLPTPRSHQSTHFLCRTRICLIGTGTATSSMSTSCSPFLHFGHLIDARFSFNTCILFQHISTRDCPELIASIHGTLKMAATPRSSRVVSQYPA